MPSDTDMLTWVGTRSTASAKGIGLAATAAGSGRCGSNDRVRLLRFAPQRDHELNLNTTGGVTFDDVRQAVQNRQGWNEDRDADGRERWYGPCPIQNAPGCRVSAGNENLSDTQEVLMACNACNRHDPGHLGRALFLNHLDAIGCSRHQMMVRPVGLGWYVRQSAVTSTGAPAGGAVDDLVPGRANVRRRRERRPTAAPWVLAGPQPVPCAPATGGAAEVRPRWNASDSAGSWCCIIIDLETRSFPGGGSRCC